VDLICETILPSPVTEHYRNRMDFVIDFEGRVGMREKGKWWKVIDEHTCFLADKKIEDLFHVVRAWVKSSGLSYYDRKSHSGLLRYAVIRSTTLGETMINIITSVPEDEKESSSLRESLTRLAKEPTATTLIWSQNSTITDISFGDIVQTISGPGFIQERIESFVYRISPNAFFQTNPHGAKILLETVTAFCGDIHQKTLLDLYCGSGFFSIALAQKTQTCIGVEMSKEAIVDARINSEINQRTIQYHDAKMEEFDWKDVGADVVILDPPRSGMHDKVLEDILHVKPKHIVYISCNYKNFAREMVQLQQYYKVEAMRAIDLFPHTPHVELVTSLILK